MKKKSLHLESPCSVRLRAAVKRCFAMICSGSHFAHVMEEVGISRIVL
jgi:hypothetical protein